MKVQNTRSAALFSRAKELFPGGVNSPVRAFKAVGGDPFIVSRGEGPYLIDVDGNKYVDYVCSWGPLVLGHAHPKVVEAIAQQAKRGTSYGACCEQEARLAERIMEAMPNIERIRFVNSGTEAALAVLRLARGFTGRTKILKFRGCYHGQVDAMLVRAGSGVATLGLPDTSGVPSEVARQTLVAEFNDIEDVKRCFAEHGSEIAAVIVEPVVGNAGLLLPEDDFLAQLKKVVREYGSLLIFDEVMTGFRVHRGGAQALYDVKPDITMLGKAIGGGLPVGAFGGRKEIMEMLAPLGPVYQAGTLAGNPLAMVAGYITLSEWLLGDIFEKAAAAAQQIVDTLKSAAEKRGIPLTAQTAGTMFGFFFNPGPVKNFSQAEQSNQNRFKKLFHGLRERGVYFPPSQYEACFISAAHLGEAVERTLEVIEEAFSEIS